MKNKNRNILIFVVVLAAIIALSGKLSQSPASVFSYGFPQLFSASNDFTFGEYNVRVSTDQMTNRCKGTGDCGSAYTFKEKDKYGCDIWQYTFVRYSGSGYYVEGCGSNLGCSCYNQFGDLTGKKYSGHTDPCPTNIGSCDGGCSWAYHTHTSITSTCGGAELSGGGTSYNYTITKNGQPFYSNGYYQNPTILVFFEDFDMRMENGGGKYVDVKIPQNKINIVSMVGESYATGQTAELKLNISNQWMPFNATATVNFRIPTAIGDMVASRSYEFGVVDSGFFQRTIPVPTTQVTDVIYIRVSLHMKINPYTYPLQGMGMKYDCNTGYTSVEFKPISYCANAYVVGVGSWQDDEKMVYIYPATKQCNTNTDCAPKCVGVAGLCVSGVCQYVGECFVKPEQDVWNSITTFFETLFNNIKNILGWK